jgi:hypothetical protein
LRATGDRDRLSNLEGRGLSGSVWSKRERFLGSSSPIVMVCWFLDVDVFVDSSAFTHHVESGKWKVESRLKSTSLAMMNDSR